MCHAYILEIKPLSVASFANILSHPESCFFFSFCLWFPWSSLGFPGSSVGKESAIEPQFNSWTRKLPWRRDRLSTSVFLGFPCGSAGKESARNEGDLGLIPGLGRSPTEGKGYPLQYSGIDNSMDYTHEVAKSRTRVSDFHFHFQRFIS